MIPNLLSISQTYGQIGLEIERAKLSIEQPKAEINMHQELPQLQIEKTPLQIQIDQQDCWNEVGLKDSKALTYDNAQRAQQIALEAIAEIAEEGNSLMSIENGKDMLVELAADSANPPPAEFNVAFLPQSKPKIDFVGGELHFSVQEGRFDWQVTPNKPIIDATSPKVSAYMLKWPSITIEYLGNNLDTRG